MPSIIGFDVGNTLLHIDTSRVANVLSGYACSVLPDRICDAERRARLAVDTELLSHLARGRVLGSGSASMESTNLWRGYFGDLLGSLGVSELHHKEIMEKLLDIERSELPGLWNRLLPGTKAMLADLKSSGYLLAAVSNSDGRLHRKLAAVNLDRYFDLIVDSKEEGVEKPEAKIFNIVVERLHCRDGKQLIYIGDLYSVDVLGARKAGHEALLFDPANYYGGIADGVIARWGELIQLLRSADHSQFPVGARGNARH